MEISLDSIILDIFFLAESGMCGRYRGEHGKLEIDSGYIYACVYVYISLYTHSAEIYYYVYRRLSSYDAERTSVVMDLK